MMRIPVLQTRRAVVLGAIAGLAGGLAEVVWVSLYGTLAGVDAAAVARGISRAVGLGETASPAITGLAVHLLLAVALGIALATTATRLVRDSYRPWTGHLLVLVVLVAVWAINFTIVLPRLSPSFVTLLPYQVTLLSKLLFGLAAAQVLFSRPVPRGAERSARTT